MISPFHSIVGYEEDQWQDFLEKICLIDIFLPVIKAYPNTDLLKCVIRYIVYAYSPDSDKIILGMEWQKNKQQIFEFVLAKPQKTIYEDLVHLKNKAVLDTVNRWMQFIDQDSFTQLQVLKDLRVEMQISSLSDIKKASGEYDYDQKFRNAKYANDLKEMIRDLESELIQNNSKLKEAFQEVKKANRNKMTIGVEMFST